MCPQRKNLIEAGTDELAFVLSRRRRHRPTTNPKTLDYVYGSDLSCSRLVPKVSTGDAMGDAENDRFNMIRRNSLRNEVDGSFEELEEVEDSSETPQTNSEF